MKLTSVSQTILKGVYMTTTRNTKKPTASKQSAVQTKSAASTAKSSVNKPEAKSDAPSSVQAAQVGRDKQATETTTVDNKNASPAKQADKPASGHIADQIQVFPRRRVWPD
ncbi:MAG: hypothetical protein R3219_03105 [Hydrogenovibrio sp.]|nr:hypothetical protein [Hydrogenovibrio sp.]